MNFVFTTEEKIIDSETVHRLWTIKDEKTIELIKNAMKNNCYLSVFFLIRQNVVLFYFEYFFKKLYEQDDIYKSEYEGLYCTPCESFWTESQLVDGKCPDCGREVKPAVEEAYFFKKPCIIMRSETEWKEIVEVGAAIIADANEENIVNGYYHFKDNNISEYPELFGDGKAAEFICNELINNK